MSAINKIYGKNLPKPNTYVNFVFTDRNEHILSCVLTDYGIDAIMPLSLLTTRKKIRSINKLSPLDKPMIGFVDNIDDGVVTLSLAYNDPDCDEYKQLLDTNTYLVQLRKKINQYSHINNIPVDTILKNNIYPFDDDRIECNSTDNLYMYIINNIDKLYDESFSQFLIEGHKDFISTDSRMHETKFKFISTGGVNHTKEIFSKLLEKYTDLNVNIISTPEYRIFSQDTIKNRELQQQFISELKEMSNTYKPNIHVALC